MKTFRITKKVLTAQSDDIQANSLDEALDIAYSHDFYGNEEVISTDYESDAPVDNKLEGILILPVYARVCSHCGKGMSEGFIVDGEYYCTDECLHEHYTEEEYRARHDDDNDRAYWTQWEEITEDSFILKKEDDKYRLVDASVEGIQFVEQDGMTFEINGDDFEFHMICIDGFAYGTNGNVYIEVAYPLIEHLTVKQVKEILDYKGGEDRSLVLYSEVAQMFGTVIKVSTDTPTIDSKAHPDSPIVILEKALAKIQRCRVDAWNGDLEETIDAVALENFKGDGESPDTITVFYNGWLEDIMKALDIMKHS